MTYDHWKTTEPQPSSDGYECDCCGRTDGGEISRVWAYGIETFACARCRGDEEEADEIMDNGRNTGGR